MAKDELEVRGERMKRRASRKLDWIDGVMISAVLAASYWITTIQF